MTADMLAVLLGAASVTSAFIGPWLLRRAAPALVRVPRLAIVVVVGGILVWLGTVLAIGPLLAWAGSGPVLLPEGAAGVCRRCLAAANPFSAAVTETAIPAIPAALLLGVPAILTVALTVGVVGQGVRRRSRSRLAARAVVQGSRPHHLHGHDVALVDAERPFAIAFPARQGGIVLSTAAVRELTDEELAAVLTHESAHLRQHHHLISGSVDCVTAYLRWVPLVRAAADVLPHYLEIAADDQARRAAGTPALVGALIKLGERTRPVMPHSSPIALHAAGPERVRQLVRPSAGPAGVLPAVAITASLVALAVVSAAVHLPYASAALTGC